MAEGEKWSGQPLGTAVGSGDTLSMLQGGDNVQLPFDVLIDEVNGIPVVYDISSVNTLIPPPTITGHAQKYTYFWTGGDGSNTFKFVTGTTIGGIDSALWVGEGEGHITIESDGTNYQVREYDDYYNSSNAYWKKDINGVLEQWENAIAISNAATYTFLKAFISSSYISTWTHASNSTRIMALHTRTTTNGVLRVIDDAGSAQSLTTGEHNTIGRWRT